MKMDEVLYNIAEKVKNFAVIYLVDITKVPDFNKMYIEYHLLLHYEVSKLIILKLSDIFEYKDSERQISYIKEKLNLIIYQLSKTIIYILQ